MADLSVTTINKFIRETYQDSETSMSVERKKQRDFLEKLKEEFETDERLQCHLLTRWDYEERKSMPVPEMQISYVAKNDERWRNDRGTFVIGFRGEATFLKIWSNSWRSREPKIIRPLSDPQQIDRLIVKIEERFKQNQLKNKKKSSTEGFKVQAIKARLNQMAEELEFDFAVENKHHHFRVYIRKDGLGPLCIKLAKGKTEETELEKLPEYINHSLAHLAYSDVILNSKLTHYQASRLNWTTHD